LRCSSDLRSWPRAARPFLTNRCNPAGRSGRQWSSFPVFIPITQPRSLVLLLTIPLVKLLGVAVLALRLTSALVGGDCSAGLPAGPAVVCRRADRRARVLGLFAAALMATHSGMFSKRYGYRAITLPLMQSLLLFALWRGFSLNRRKWMSRRRVVRPDRLHLLSSRLCRWRWQSLE